MSKKWIFGIMLGIFLGNWLVSPLVSQVLGGSWSFSDGFCIGMLAAILCGVSLVIYNKIDDRRMKEELNREMERLAQKKIGRKK